MSKELGLLNFLCILVALGFLAVIIVSAILSGDFFTIDNLFIITVCLVMALVFAVLPLMYLRSEGKLPLPFVSKSVLSPSGDRKSTRLNSSHSQISYAVFCLKKKRRRKHLARVRA